MINFLTNTYAEGAPVRVDNTVREQALLAQTQARNYNAAQQSYLDNQEKLLQLQGAPGGQYWINKFNKRYADEFGRAQEEGNFEDMVGNADALVREGYDKYNLRNVIRDREKYEGELKALQEGDLPQNYKDFLIKENIISNPGVVVDEQGNEKYVPYRSMRNLTYENVPEALSKIITGWKDDGIYQANQDGSFTILKDIPGYDAIKKNTTITREELRAFARDYMQNEANINQSIIDQADVATKSILYNKGSFDANDAMVLVNQDNPFSPGTTQYKQYVDFYSKNFNKLLELRRQQAQQQGLKFNEQEEILNIAQILKDDSLRNSYSNMMEDKFGFLKEQLTTFKREDLNGKDPEEIPFQTGIFTNTTVGTSDTFDFNRHNNNKKDLNSQLIAERVELNRLMNSGEATTPMIDEQKAKVERLSKELEANNNLSLNTAENLFNNLKGKGALSSKPSKDPITGREYPGVPKDYDTFKERAYDKYLKDLETGGSTSGISLGFGVAGTKTNNYQDLYRSINPNATFQNDKQPLSKEQFFDLLDKEITSNAYGGEYNQNFLVNYGFKPSEYIKENPEDSSLFQNYQLFDLDLTDTTGKQRIPYQEYNQVMSSITNTVLSDLGNFSAIDGTPLTELTKDLSINEEGVSMKLISSPINGELAAQMELPVQNEDGEKAVIKTFVNLSSGNNNAEIIKNRLKQAMTGLQKDLMSNYKNLKPDKQEMLYATNNMLNIIDGSLARFNSIPLYTAQEGEIFDFELGDDTYRFIPYQIGQEGRNRTLVMQHNVFGEVADVEGTKRQQNGMGILGYHANELDSQGRPLLDANGSPRKPKYYLYSTNAERSPFQLNEDGQRVVKLASWFKPADYGSPTKTFERVSFEAALRRGNIDKSALPSEQVYKYHEEYTNNYSSASTIDSHTDNMISKGYTRENFYTPLNSIAPSSQISTNVKLPFLAIKSEGANRLSKMFNDLNKTGYKLMITGAGRDDNNVVRHGADNSEHKDFFALDLLKNPASLYLANLPEEKLREYGISKVLTNYDDHIHIEIDKNYFGAFVPVDKF